MSAPAFLLIGVLFLDGEPKATEAGDLFPTSAACVEYAHKAADKARTEFPATVQIVYKCVDLSQVPLAVSVFGSQAPAVTK